MGLLDFTSKILSEYKADISDHKAKVRELSGEQKDLAKAELDAAEARNKQADSYIDKLGKWALGLGAVAIAAKVGFDAIEFAGKRADLASAAAGVSIEGLRKATFGLRTDTELLTTAARLNHSVFSLTQKDMEVAAQAMTALGERGGDAQEAIDAVTEALVSGKTKGLKAYGIEVDETKDKASKFRDIMKELTKVSGEVSESSFDASDKVSMLKVSFSNVIDNLKEGFGKLILSLEPLLVLLAKAVGLIADIASHVPGGSGTLAGAAIGSAVLGPGVGTAIGAATGYAVQGPSFWEYQQQFRDADQYGGGIDISQVLGTNGGTGGSDGLSFNVPGLIGRGITAARSAAYYGEGAINQATGRTAKGAKAATSPAAVKEAAEDAARSILRSAIFEEQRNLTGEQSGYVLNGKFVRPSTDLSLGAKAEEGPLRDAKGNLTTITALNQQALNEKLTQNWFDRLNAAKQPQLGDGIRAVQTSYLEKTFGKLEEFNAYATAFSTLTGAVSSALGAWIEGSMSAGKAIKAFIGQALEGLASQMAVEALKHGAYAIGSLAFGDFRGAALHGEAAAAFTLGAAAAAIAAKEMGHGGKDYSKSAGAGGGAKPGAPNVSGSGAAAPPASGPIIVYSDAFAEDNARGKQLQAQKMVDRALGNSWVQRS